MLYEEEEASMIEIKGGSNLDLAVANAIGMTWYGSRTIMEAWWHKDGNRCRRTLPAFSTNLNDAFMAAKETGLFLNWLLTDSGSGWYFLDHSERDMDGVNAPTPALAICAAILRIFEEREVA